ncbi:MAG: hypothetical protein HWE10_00965 [Gammaproteobacteria bacterium]|nr:hypothetical protein [Gammaproteobacteria bacterium]
MSNENNLHSPIEVIIQLNVKQQKLIYILYIDKILLQISDLVKNITAKLWLNRTGSDKNLSENQRQERLCEWEKAPGARYCHPREEHLLPLHVCYGAAGRGCDEVYNIEVLNQKCSMYLWR